MSHPQSSLEKGASVHPSIQCMRLSCTSAENVGDWLPPDCASRKRLPPNIRTPDTTETNMGVKGYLRHLFPARAGSTFLREPARGEVAVHGSLANARRQPVRERASEDQGVAAGDGWRAAASGTRRGAGLERSSCAG